MSKILQKWNKARMEIVKCRKIENFRNMNQKRKVFAKLVQLKALSKKFKKLKERSTRMRKVNLMKSHFKAWYKVTVKISKERINVKLMIVLDPFNLQFKDHELS